jgi:acyl-CoA synthetase (AMP-forming)/AMP-acid ligase II
MTKSSANVVDYLLADKDPERIALHFLSGDISYGKLQSACEGIADHLLRTGAEKGDRIIVVGDNSFFWVAAYLGIMKAGLVVVPLPSDISSLDLKEISRSVGARVLVAESGPAIRFGELLQDLNVLTDRTIATLPGVASQASLLDVEAQTVVRHQELPAVDRDDLAALMFTSGSTGKPRGVMVSHANIVANTGSIIEYLGLDNSDRMMTILPFHYCFGASLLHTHLRVGGSLVIDPRFTYPEAILQRMRDSMCTGFAGVPSHYQILLRRSSLKAKSLPHLRHVQQAGGHLAPAFLRELREALPATKVFVMYGQTEATARLAYLQPELLEKKLGSIGKAIPGVSLKILNELGEEVRNGEVGEIVADGPNITRGYWGDPVETARSFRDGKLYTGDMATVDKDGCIFIVDRAKSFLKCGGRRVSTRQLEELILEFQPLREAAVVGIPDDVLGEAVKAFVVPRDDVFPDLQKLLILHCRQRMPQEFVPRQIVFLESLPKSSTGKVLKEALKSMLPCAHPALSEPVKELV